VYHFDAHLKLNIVHDINAMSELILVVLKPPKILISSNA